MNSENWIILAAFAIAALMAYKPVMFIPNEKHRSPSFIRALRYIGMSVAIVIAIWFILTLTLKR
ncbi:MAG: hypothetical protein IJV41_06235 [Oscillospiraceae bacterium]|nr:hypothetical protein [Oscillospiraceae bacterium]